MFRPVLNSAVRNRASLMAAQRRSMGSGGPPPKWEGIDKVVRGTFPEDYQLAIAILSGYGGLYVLYKISSMFSSKKPAAVEAAPVTVVEVVTSGVPSIESPEFDKFLDTDAFSKLLENEEQLVKAIEG